MSFDGQISLVLIHDDKKSPGRSGDYVTHGSAAAQVESDLSPFTACLLLSLSLLSCPSSLLYHPIEAKMPKNDLKKIL